jgi:hypothetical protein
MHGCLRSIAVSLVTVFFSFWVGSPICFAAKNDPEPEFIYINVPEHWVPAVITLPNHADAAFALDNPAADPKLGTVSVKLKNNGTYKMHPKLDARGLINAIEMYLGESDHKFFNDLLDVGDKSGTIVPVTDMKWLLLRFYEKNLERRRFIEYEINRVESQAGTLYRSQHESHCEIDSIIFRGAKHSLSEFQAKKELLHGAERSFEYLYRAVTTSEWKSILSYGKFTIPVRTNFEKNIGPQVELYAKEEGYAGKVIRIPVEGPFFRHAGMQVPRVESFIPHFAEVEVLTDGKWIPLRETGEYKASHSNTERVCRDALIKTAAVEHKPAKTDPNH